MRPPPPPPSVLELALTDRYSRLAASCDSLSCGSALELGAPRPGEVVLDLGCGRGEDVLEAARRVGRTGVAIGVDLCAEMIEAACAAARTMPGNVSFVRSDLARLELPRDMADLVISSCAINHAPDKAAVYREIHRVLRPGGRFVVSDIVAEEEVPDTVRLDPRAWAGCYGGAILESEYLAAVRAAGFDELTILQRSAPYPREGVLLRSITIRGVRAAIEG